MSLTAQFNRLDYVGIAVREAIQAMTPAQLVDSERTQLFDLGVRRLRNWVDTNNNADRHQGDQLLKWYSTGYHPTEAELRSCGV